MAVAALRAAAGESTPEMPNHADAKVPCGTGRGTGSAEGGERQVLSALETAVRTARSKHVCSLLQTCMQSWMGRRERGQ